jgi:hypothetical protein
MVGEFLVRRKTTLMMMILRSLKDSWIQWKGRSDERGDACAWFEVSTRKINRRMAVMAPLEEPLSVWARLLCYRSLSRMQYQRQMGRYCTVHIHLDFENPSLYESTSRQRVSSGTFMRTLLLDQSPSDTGTGHSHPVSLQGPSRSIAEDLHRDTNDLAVLPS